MSLTLTKIEAIGTGALRASYDLQHYTPGREGTTLSEPLELMVDPKRTVVKLLITDCDGPTPDEALARLSAWLRRLADGLDQRDKSINLPLT